MIGKTRPAGPHSPNTYSAPKQMAGTPDGFQNPESPGFSFGSDQPVYQARALYCRRLWG